MTFFQEILFSPLCYGETVNGCIMIFIDAEKISQFSVAQLLICKCSTSSIYFEDGVNVNIWYIQ